MKNMDPKFLCNMKFAKKHNLTLFSLFCFPFFLKKTFFH